MHLVKQKRNNHLFFTNIAVAKSTSNLTNMRFTTQAEQETCNTSSSLSPSISTQQKPGNRQLSFIFSPPQTELTGLAGQSFYFSATDGLPVPDNMYMFHGRRWASRICFRQILSFCLPFVTFVFLLSVQLLFQFLVFLCKSFQVFQNAV